MEPRARASRHKSSLNFPRDLTNFLYAYGAPTHPDRTDPHPGSDQYVRFPPTQNTSHKPTPYDAPFPETVRVLDEILTDFIIETCHAAVNHATLVGRQKLTIHDFKSVIHKDRAKLGRVQEMLAKSQRIQKEKKLDFGEMSGGQKMKVDDMVALGDIIGEEGTGKGKGRGRGRRKNNKRKADSEEPRSEKDDEDGDEEEERSERSASKGVKRARSDVG